MSCRKETSCLALINVFIYQHRVRSPHRPVAVPKESGTAHYYGYLFVCVEMQRPRGKGEPSHLPPKEKRGRLAAILGSSKGVRCPTCDKYTPHFVNHVWAVARRF